MARYGASFIAGRDTTNCPADSILLVQPVARWELTSDRLKPKGFFLPEVRAIRGPWWSR